MGGGRKRKRQSGGGGSDAKNRVSGAAAVPNQEEEEITAPTGEGRDIEYLYQDPEFETMGWQQIDFPENFFMNDDEDLAGVVTLEAVDGSAFDEYVRRHQPKDKDASATFPETNKEGDDEEDDTQPDDGKTQTKKKKKKKKKKKTTQTEQRADDEEEDDLQEPVAKKQKITSSSSSSVSSLNNNNNNITEKEEEQKVSAKQDKAKKKKQKKNSTSVKKWQDLGANIDETILRGLVDLGFDTPTPIQRAAIVPAVRDYKDILGAAATGSGKTLAFGIPIVQRLLELRQKKQPQSSSSSSSTSVNIPRHALGAIVLTPTRELAIQIMHHVSAITTHNGLKAVSIVGNMSEEKQLRQLRQEPDIVVATPGRLWKLISSHDTILNDLSELRVFVLDEADRMLAKGHFPELQSILNHIRRSRDRKEQQNDDSKGDDEDESDVVLHKMQLLLFSATLTMDATGRELHTKSGKEFKKWQKILLKRASQEENSMAHLVANTFQTQPHVVDLSTAQHTVQTLSETRISCDLFQKDAYLLYYLSLHPGRKLVFVNSITCLKRLLGVFSSLQVRVFGLHAQMQQRQRLKSLERFMTTPDSVLMCTDVAARGLDLPLVEHVVHYQVPRSSEVYVHRCGRTARAGRAGQSLILVCAEEHSNYKRICDVLKKEHGVPLLDVDEGYMPAITDRAMLAAKIDKRKNILRRSNEDDNWFTNAAKELDMVLDEDLLKVHNLSEEDQVALAEEKNEIKALERELKLLLKQPLVPTQQRRRELLSMAHHVGRV